MYLDNFSKTSIFIPKLGILTTMETERIVLRPWLESDAGSLCPGKADQPFTRSKV